MRDVIVSASSDELRSRTDILHVSSRSLNKVYLQNEIACTQHVEFAVVARIARDLCMGADS